MAEYCITISDEVQDARTHLTLFARTLENGRALVTPIPAGFPMGAMPEVASRVAYMMRQYVEVYAPKPEKEARDAVPVE